MVSEEEDRDQEIETCWCDEGKERKTTAREVDDAGTGKAG